MLVVKDDQFVLTITASVLNVHQVALCVPQFTVAEELDIREDAGGVDKQMDSLRPDVFDIQLRRLRAVFTFFTVQHIGHLEG